MQSRSPFFYTATPTTEIYTLSLHDALPISIQGNPPPYYPQGLGSCAQIDLDFGSSANLFRDAHGRLLVGEGQDRKSTRLNSSHTVISYAVFCLKKKKKTVLK